MPIAKSYSIIRITIVASSVLWHSLFELMYFYLWNRRQILPEKLLIRKFRLLLTFCIIQHLHSYSKSNLGGSKYSCNTESVYIPVPFRIDSIQSKGHDCQYICPDRIFRPGCIDFTGSNIFDIIFIFYIIILCGRIAW